MECQPQSSPPEPCPLYWSCQISRGHSIKSEFQISKKCMGSLNDYLLLTHTHTRTHTHTHTHILTGACMRTCKPGPVISEAGLPTPRDAYRRAQRAGACSPRAVGSGLSRPAQTQPLLWEGPSFSDPRRDSGLGRGAGRQSSLPNFSICLGFGDETASGMECLELPFPRCPAIDPSPP